MKMPKIELQGVMVYPSTEESRPFPHETLRLMREIDVHINIIGGGGTGCEATSKALGCNETRSGSYAFEGQSGSMQVMSQIPRPVFLE